MVTAARQYRRCENKITRLSVTYLGTIKTILRKNQEDVILYKNVTPFRIEEETKIMQVKKLLRRLGHTLGLRSNMDQQTVTNVTDRPITLEEGSEIRALLDKLGQKYGEYLKANIQNTEGDLLRGVFIIVNGENIRNMQGLNTKIQPDAQIQIALVPAAIAG